MAKDVDATLRKIVQEQGGKSFEEANEYVEKQRAISAINAMCIK
jgi:sulfite reductase alpha subunit-like flavoprotein